MRTHLDHIRETWGEVGTYVREVWGPAAVFDLVGRTCLIHLDRPDACTRTRRIAEQRARAAELAGADCPLCREMAVLGGDQVFDGNPVGEGEGAAANRDGRGPEEADPAGPEEAGVLADLRADAVRDAGGGGDGGSDAAGVRGDLLADPGAEEVFDIGPWSRAGIRLDVLDRLPPRMARHVLLAVVRSHVEEVCADLAAAETDGGLAAGLRREAIRAGLLTGTEPGSEAGDGARVAARDGAQTGAGGDPGAGPGAGPATSTFLTAGRVRWLRRRMAVLGRRLGQRDGAGADLLSEKLDDLRDKLSALAALIEREPARPVERP